MRYKIVDTGVSFDAHRRAVSVDIVKRPFFFWMKQKPMMYKVFFDLYDFKVTHKVYNGYATIDKDWINLGYKNRNQIKNLLIKHFAGDYTIGNFCNTIKKL